MEMVGNGFNYCVTQNDIHCGALQMMFDLLAQYDLVMTLSLYYKRRSWAFLDDHSSVSCFAEIMF